MKTRTVEIPICDRCSQDGELYVICDITGAPLLKIARCERHLHRLSQEAAVTNEGRPAPALAPAASLLLDLIRAEPGLSNAEYIARHPESKATWGRAPMSLEERGLISCTTDEEGNRHYWPISETQMSETTEEVLDADTTRVSA
jgi:hypothetical protein